METDMIKITHLKKSFGDVKAVNDFDHLRAASQRQRNGSDPGHRSG